MSVRVTVTYACNGCDATVTAPEQVIKREFVSLSGRGHGIGSYVMTPVEIVAVAPEGWVPFDPFTQCCYCPACWAEICQNVGTMKGNLAAAEEAADRV
jgi:hypothetical protein